MDYQNYSHQGYDSQLYGQDPEDSEIRVQRKVGFFEAYKMFFKNYFNFSGRSSRSEFWYASLANFLVFIILIALMFWGMSGAFMESYFSYENIYTQSFGEIIFWLYIIYLIAIIIPSLSLAVRRLHDTGRSGWWLMASIGPTILSYVFAYSGNYDAASLMSFLSSIGGIVLLVFYCFESDTDTNEWGEVPNLE